MSSPRRIFACVAVLTALIRAQAPDPVSAEDKIPLKLAVPVEPIAAIVDAFRSDRIVALGDNHGNEQGHKFRLSLIRDPRFAAAVDDIVVEFGSARYQDLMDRPSTAETSHMNRCVRFGRIHRNLNNNGICRSMRSSSVPCIQ
jgi:hypothetical protein